MCLSVCLSQVNCLLRSLLREQRVTPPSSGCFSAIPAVLGSRKLDFSHCRLINLTNCLKYFPVDPLEIVDVDYLSYRGACSHAQTHTHTHSYHATAHTSNTKAWCISLSDPHTHILYMCLYAWLAQTTWVIYGT